MFKAADEHVFTDPAVSATQQKRRSAMYNEELVALKQRKVKSKTFRKDDRGRETDEPGFSNNCLSAVTRSCFFAKLAAGLKIAFIYVWVHKTVSHVPSKQVVVTSYLTLLF